LAPTVDTDEDALRGSASRLLAAGSGQVRPGRAFALGALGGVLAIVLGAGIVWAGAPAREPTAEHVLAEAPPEVTAHVDPASLPTVTVDPDVADLSPELASGPGAQELAVTLAENLETESQALLEVDPHLLTAVDYGDRLRQLRRQLREALASGTATVRAYTFDALNLVPIVAPGDQSGLSLGFEATGTVEVVTYEDGERTGSTAEPFATTFMLSRPTGGRWLTMGTLPFGERTLRTGG
jgi:hypothetical protein